MRRSNDELPAPCSEQKQIVELQKRLKAEEQRRDEARDKVESARRTLETAKEGLEHLAGKLSHVTLGGPALEEAMPRSSQDLKDGAATQVEFLPGLKGSHSRNPPRAGC